MEFKKIEDISNEESLDFITEEEIEDTSLNNEKNLRISEKIQTIERVLNSYPIDLEKLKQLAISNGGFIKDELRKLAWPQLMQLENMEFSPSLSYEKVKNHKDYNQVVLDVNRSLKRFPPGIDEQYRYILMKQLTNLIIRVLDKHPHLHYYQGYHDVVITFLLVTGETTGFNLVEKLSITHLADFMRPTMEKTTYYLTYIYPIVKRANMKLYDHLVKSHVGTVFCLPWLITWYAHTLSDYRNVVRLYDFFLATPYLMPMYIAAAIVLHREKDILEEDCDMATQHFVLSQVPDCLPFEDLLLKASDLYELYPPDDLHEEVEDFIHKKKLEEEEERKLGEKKRKKFISSKRSSPLNTFFGFLFGTEVASPFFKGFIKIIIFAFAATFATGLYGYYTNSPYLTQYSHYFKKSNIPS